jgi:hypothetical protein
MRRTVVLATVLCCGVAACGMKADPRPPDAVRPSTIESLGAEPTPDGIRLTWTRPTTTMDGKSMPDLDGILITRAIDVSPPTEPPDLLFEHIATIHLDDRERFHKVRRMTFDDRSVTPGQTYAYRVQAFTFDRYVSAPSPAARAAWPGRDRPATRKDVPDVTRARE